MANFPLAVRTEKDNLLSGFGSRLIIPFSTPDLDWAPGYELTWIACGQQAVQLFEELGSALSYLGSTAWSLSGSALP